MPKFFRSTASVLIIAAAHFLICRLVVAATMALNLTGGGTEPSLITRMLVGATRLLYFPVISLSLYSRQMFPGNWIFIPIFINSLIWGVVLYLGYQILRKTIMRKRL